MVPSTAFVSAAIAATASVSFSAATASGEETAAQKPEPPPLVDDQPSAAIGSATTTDRNDPTKPSASADPPRRRAQAAGETAAALTARRRPSDCPLDPDHQPLARIEPLPVGGAPAADRRVVDRDQTGPGGKLLRELLRRDRVDRAEAVLSEDLLLRLRLEEADEIVRHREVRALRDHRNRQLDQHRLPGDHVLDVLALQPRVDRLALVRDQDVALP